MNSRWSESVSSRILSYCLLKTVSFCKDKQSVHYGIDVGYSIRLKYIAILIPYTYIVSACDGT